MTDKSPAKTPSPPLPWKTRLYIAVLSAITDACCRSNGTMNRRILSVVDSKTPPKGNPIKGVRTADVIIDPTRDLWIRLFVPSPGPADGRKIPIIIFYHGGGFAYLSPASWAYDAVCRRICRKIPVMIASVNYRLAPEHRFPAQYEDGVDALRFLDGGGLDGADPDAASLVDLSSCFLGGDSAGGNIAHNVARRWAGGGGWERVKLAGLVAIQPWFGGEERTEAEVRLAGAPLVSTERTDWLWRAFLPEGTDRDHEAANVFGPRAASELGENFPPVAVVVGGYDPLQDWQRRYYEGLRERGVEARLVEFPDAIHAFYVFPELPDSSKLIDMLKEFIETHRSTAATATATEAEEVASR